MPEQRRTPAATLLEQCGPNGACVALKAHMVQCGSLWLWPLWGHIVLLPLYCKVVPILEQHCSKNVVQG